MSWPTVIWSMVAPRHRRWRCPTPSSGFARVGRGSNLLFAVAALAVGLIAMMELAVT